MKKYIELKVAVELAMQYCPDDDGTCSKADRDIRELLDELENLPYIQLDMQLIRCKDCLFFTTEKSCCRPEGLTKAREDAFCSYGERREE